MTRSIATGTTGVLVTSGPALVPAQPVVTDEADSAGPAALLETWQDNGEPLPLSDLDDAVERHRPCPWTSVPERITYHRRAAATYAELAEVHRWYYDEALFWARREREKAEELQEAGATTTQ